MWLREILHPIQTSFPGSVFKDQGPNGVPWDRRTGGLRKYLPSKGTLGRSNRTLCSLVPEHGSTYVLNKTIGVLHPNHSDIGSLFKKTQEGTSLPKTLPVNWLSVKLSPLKMTPTPVRAFRSTVNIFRQRLKEHVMLTTGWIVRYTCPINPSTQQSGPVYFKSSFGRNPMWDTIGSLKDYPPTSDYRVV